MLSTRSFGHMRMGFFASECTCTRRHNLYCCTPYSPYISYVFIMALHPHNTIIASNPSSAPPNRNCDIHPYTRTNTRTHKRTQTHTQTQAHTHTHTHKHIHTGTRTNTHKHIHSLTHSPTHAHTNTHTHTHTHTHRRIHLQSLSRRPLNGHLLHLGYGPTLIGGAR